jgi:hypothetical protein
MSNNTTEIKTATRYDYPANGGYADTVATLADGRRMLVNSQYADVSPYGVHAADCEQLTKMGGHCTCGLLAGIDVRSLVADARINGIFGAAPVKRSEIEDGINDKTGICTYCHTYCHGDCRS